MHFLGVAESQSLSNSDLYSFIPQLNAIILQYFLLATKQFAPYSILLIVTSLRFHSSLKAYLSHDVQCKKNRTT